jgi:transposase-like protein
MLSPGPRGPIASLDPRWRRGSCPKASAKTRTHGRPVPARRLVEQPEGRAGPRDLEALAQELGVNPKTLQRWRTKLDLDAVAAERARGRLLESLPTVYRVLAEKAEEGSHDHMNLYLGVALTKIPPRESA